MYIYIHINIYIRTHLRTSNAYQDGIRALVHSLPALSIFQPLAGYAHKRDKDLILEYAVKCGAVRPCVESLHVLIDDLLMVQTKVFSVCMCVCVYVYVCMHVYMYICICTCTCA